MDPETQPAPATPGASPAAPPAPGALPPAPVVGAQDDSETRRIKRENQALRKRLDEFTTAQAQAEQTRLAESGQHKERADRLEAQLRETQAAHAAAAREALITRLAHKHNLPEALWSRVQGQEEADIEADIKALVALIPPPAAPAPVVTGGGPTNPPKGGSGALTLERIKAMTPQEYSAHRTEIQAFLATQ